VTSAKFNSLNLPEEKLFNSVKSDFTYENLPKTWQKPENKTVTKS